MQLATYMFPPIRRDEALVGSNDRFTACQAAEYSVQWDRLRLTPERIRLPGACAGCRLKEICHACAAMCVTETGHFDTKPEYVCEMTHETVRRTIEEAENGNS